MRYYATGTRKVREEVTGETYLANIIIPLTETTRVEAVNQANRIAKRDRVTIDRVLPVKNQ